MWEKLPSRVIVPGVVVPGVVVLEPHVVIDRLLTQS